MESQQTGVHLPRSFWSLAALTVTWWTLAPGVYFLFSGAAEWGTLLSAVGIVALVASLSGPIQLRLAARAVYRPLAVLFVLTVVVMALTELWMTIAFGSGSPFAPGLLALHGALLLVGGGATGMQLLQTQRQA
ncbi:MAG TPA: hypothetical protein VGA07_11410 [Anaerolineales bacterium]